jgi:hypothetical protein
MAGRSRQITIADMRKGKQMSEMDCVLKEFGNCSYSETGCSDCKVKAKIRNTLSAQPLSVQPEPCKEAVRREDVQSIAERSDWFESSDSFNDFMWALYELPSVTPKRKTGKWEIAYLDHVSIGTRPKVLYCSECNQCIAYPTNYCPNCGAKMSGGGQE